MIEEKYIKLNEIINHGIAHSKKPKIKYINTAPVLPLYLNNLIRSLVSQFQELRRHEVRHSFESAKTIKRGDLIHGIRNAEIEDLLKILDTGIISGEIGFEGKDRLVSEDSETHYHADFFVNTLNSVSIQNYLDWTNENENPDSRLRKKRMESSFMPKANNDTIAMVIDPSHPDLEEYLQFATNGKIAQKFRSTFHDLATQFPVASDRHFAIPVGLPSNFCKAIVTGGKINSEQLNMLKIKINQEGLSIYVFDSMGECIFRPILNDDPITE